MEYDEDRELTRYVWNHYGHLLTKFEWDVGRAIMYRQKFPTHQSPQSAALRHWHGSDDPDIESALADGSEAFRHRVRKRLLSEHGTKVFVNRCKSCGRVVGTPKARQCFWCGFDWHNLDGRG